MNSAKMLRTFSTQLKSISYYTTPIYYVNANPHIGHLYSSVIADAFQRWQQLLHKDAEIRFSTGTDEHGTKIQQAAEKFRKTPAEYCNEISSKYVELSKLFNVDYTHFIRTTDAEHVDTVKQFWNVLDKNGHIYRSKYEGWYCVSDETFLTDSQLKETVLANGEKIITSADSGHPVEWTQEENYIFKLNAFQEDLRYWLTRNENIVRPKKFQKILLDMVNNDSLPDVSISRPSSRVHWGITVPGDDSQTVYVWLDALVNYLTVAGYSRVPEPEFRRVWPPDVQVIGKDILKFHGVYWPAFLMAAGLDPPASILCHSHWTVDGEKMSKSKNNVVCPVDRAQIYTSDGMRYFLLREGVAHSDGNYSDVKVLRILNSELADTLGNLLSRCCAPTLNPGQVVPRIERSAFESALSADVTKKLIENVTSLPDVCKQHYADMNFYKVVDSVIATLHSANLFFETFQPWELRKRPDTLKDLDVVLHITMETLRVSATLLQPIVPNISGNVLNKISVPTSRRFVADLDEISWNDIDFNERKLSPEKAVLFRRIVLEEERRKPKDAKRA